MIGLLAASIGIWVGALGGPDSPMRDAALDSLVASQRVTEVSLSVFRQNWRTREGLIDVLERLGATDQLAYIATHHPKVDAQRLALRSLGRTGKKEAQGPLRSLLQSEHRDLAVEALGQVGNASDIRRVRLLLVDDRADVRRRAALALVRLAGVDALMDLGLLLGDRHHSVRFAVFGSLLSFGPKSAAVVLQQYAHLPRVGKQLALRLFGQLRYVPAKPVLAEALNGAVWPVQLAAVQAVQAWGGHTWVPILKKAQNRVSSPVVMSALNNVMQQLQH